MKVTVEVRRVGPWRWMAEGDYDGEMIFGYGNSGEAAERNWVANVHHRDAVAGSAYTKEIDV